MGESRPRDHGGSEVPPPKNLGDILGQPRAIKILRREVELLKRGVAPSQPFYFVGPTGTGKTTTAHAFAREFEFQTRAYEWVCGGENTVRALRQFMEQNVGYVWRPEGEFPILLIDEFERYTKKDRIALRRPIETFATTRPVIITANSEIDDVGLASRFVRVEFVPLDRAASGAFADKCEVVFGRHLSERAREKAIRESKGDARKILAHVRYDDEGPPERPQDSRPISGNQGRSRGGRPEREVDMVQLDLRRKAGASWSELAKEMGVPDSTLQSKYTKWQSESRKPSNNPSE